MERFTRHSKIRVSLVVTNNPAAGVIKIAEEYAIPVLVIEKEKFLSRAYINELQDYQVDFIVLAGFLWKVPQALIDAFRHKIINIHPALLPKYGGKGMYGLRVHKAVIDNKEKESGITIHYVDELYDNGDIIFQEKCGVLESDTPESLGKRVSALEHKFYPAVIEGLLVSDPTDL